MTITKILSLFWAYTLGPSRIFRVLRATLGEADRLELMAGKGFFQDAPPSLILEPFIPLGVLGSLKSPWNSKGQIF